MLGKEEQPMPRTAPRPKCSELGRKILAEIMPQT
jgi:hypothetical protein